VYNESDDIVADIDDLVGQHLVDYDDLKHKEQEEI
jgi:hypothetical protein